MARIEQQYRILILRRPNLAPWCSRNIKGAQGVERESCFSSKDDMNEQGEDITCFTAPIIFISVHSVSFLPTHTPHPIPSHHPVPPKLP